DSVDPRLVVDSIGAGGMVCAAPGQSISCTLAHLAAGDTKTVMVSYHVATTTNSALGVSNTANLTSEDGSAAPSSDTVDIVEDVQLSVSKVFNSDTVTAG